MSAPQTLDRYPFPLGRLMTLRTLAAATGFLALAFALVVALGSAYYAFVANPRVARELLEDPSGERAQKVMLITLPSGRQLPVNYLREGNRVYAAADGRWGQELEADGAPVSLVVRGETLAGSARAVLDDPDYTKRIFERLRPDAIEGFGTLIEVRLDSPGRVDADGGFDQNPSPNEK